MSNLSNCCKAKLKKYVKSKNRGSGVICTKCGKPRYVQEKVEAVKETDALRDSISNWFSCFEGEKEVYPLAEYLVELGYSLSPTLSEQELLTDEEICNLICRSGNKWCEENGREQCSALDGAKRCVAKVLAWRGK